jgi:hypothetical protein
MSDEIRHHDAEYERQDLQARSVLIFFAGLAVMLLVAYLVVLGVFKVLSQYDNAHQPQPNPLAMDTSSAADRRTVPYDQTHAEIPKKFPEPRLEEDERRELQDVRAPEDERLESYGWVDEKNGVVHIPIERAMQLTAERGLPTRPQAGTVSASPATGADNSQAPKKTRKK